MARVSATGVFGISKNEKFPYMREGKTKNGAEYHSVNFSISPAKNNRVNMELFGMVNDTIKTKDTDNGDIEVSWDDRFDTDIVKSVASYRKNVISVLPKQDEVGNELDEDDRREYISSYDTVQYIIDHINELKDKKVTVTGQMKRHAYNGKISDRFELQNMYLAADDAKEKIQVSAIFYWNKEGLDCADWKEDKKIRVNGYTYEYVNKEEGNKYFPFTIVLDASKLNLENDRHVGLLKFKLNQLGMDYVDGKITKTLKNNKYRHINVTLNYQNGQELEEFNESMLTPLQKQQLELGLKTLDQLRPAGQTYGERVIEYKLIDFDLRGDYADGAVEIEDKPSEFEDEIVILSEEENLSEVLAKVEESSSSDDDDELEDLFG